MNTKLKKAFIGISFAALFLLGGCSQQKKANPNPVLTKSQVVQKAKKSFRSGQVIQSVTLGTDTSSQVALAPAKWLWLTLLLVVNRLSTILLTKPLAKVNPVLVKNGST